jgi:hypothetical protein
MAQAAARATVAERLPVGLWSVDVDKDSTPGQYAIHPQSQAPEFSWLSPSLLLTPPRNACES